MGYKTPAALEMAVREAAKRSPMDANRAIAGFCFHRLLCRVFNDEDCRFILKGGQGMLARTIDARYTRDIDLLAKGSDLQAALEELKELDPILGSPVVARKWSPSKLEWERCFRGQGHCSRNRDQPRPPKLRRKPRFT